MRRTVDASYRVALTFWMAGAGLALLARPPAETSAAAASAWFWQNPLPRGHLPLGSVACVSGTSCVAAGAQGSIMLTADGGAHWTDAPKPAPLALSPITCPGPTICYGLGAVLSGTGSVQQWVVLKSVDGGKTWRQPSSHLPTSAYEYLNGLVCPSVTTCLTVGGNPPNSPPPVFRTGDGGLSWHLVKVPTLQSVEFLACVTATLCYGDGSLPTSGPVAPKASIIRSVDGGKTWTLVGKPSSTVGFGPMACLGPDACIVTYTICYNCGDYALRDVELRAQYVGRESGATQRGGRGGAGPYKTVDSALSRITLHVPLQQAGTDSDIYLTGDGGKTWKHVAHVNNSGLSSPTCPDATTCYLIADQSVVRTTDGGQTWAVRPLAAFGPSTMACPDPTTCYVAAGQSVVKTGDGFDHTEETLARSGVHHWLSSLSCPSTTSCYALGPGGLAATSDGGTTWADKPAPPDQFGRLSCPSSTICYALAINPLFPDGPVAIYRSGDGAGTWQQLTLPAGAGHPGDIDCVSVTTCYATAALLGTNGPRLALLVTHNSGATWSAKTGIDAAAWAGKPAQGPLSLDRLSCPSPTTCFVMATAFPGPPGSPPTIMVLATTDGGQTWTRHVLIAKVATSNGFPQQPGFPLDCPTVTTCYAITANQPPGAHQPLPGIVLVTNDGGATWRHSVVKAKATLTDISCAGAQACRVIGSAGIFATADGGKTWQKQTLADGEPFPLLQGPAFGLPAGISCPAVDTCYAVDEVMIVGTHPLHTPRRSVGTWKAGSRNALVTPVQGRMAR